MLRISSYFRLITRAKGTILCWIILSLTLTLLIPSSSFGEEEIRGLPPSEDATYIPKLGGLLNKTLRNHYGQEKKLEEIIVLRGSTINDGKVHVPAGGLFYASSTTYDAKPFRQDPMLILGEDAYLLNLTTARVVKENVVLTKREKKLLDPSGYRLWFDYATDHYGKPYAEFAVIAPSGGWPVEMPVSTSFPDPTEAKNLKMQSGANPQQVEFFISNTYSYGATTIVAKKVTHSEAQFSKIEYPAITEAVFSLERPYVVEVRQESYRWYRNKRIYSFRKENGILVEIRDWMGDKILASKLLVPATQQEYKIADKDRMSLTSLELDIHIELVVNTPLFKGSDFVPWAHEVDYGWKDGTVSFLIYHDLIKLKNGEPWPKDNQYIVRLEPDLMTGMLKRLILENREPFTLSKEKPTFAGPIKISPVWDRKYFNVVLGEIGTDVVKNCYVRDSFFRRTDNLILWKDGRENMDFFIGMSELVVSVMEDTFLQRLADPSYGVPVTKSTFTSYPPVVPSAKWFAPDPNCAFVPKMKGFIRQSSKNRKGQNLGSSEAMVIRASYVDYRKRQIIIPPAGLYYSSRNDRNIRPLAGEAFYILGRKVYLLSTESYLVVRKNFTIDRWKETPTGDGNLLFWQDVPLGDGSKALRYMEPRFLWGMPVASLRITKYSGNTFGMNILVANHSNLGFQTDSKEYRYSLPELSAEGATYFIPKWVAPDYVEVAEMGTPGMDSFTITYEEPKHVVLKTGQQVALGKYQLRVERVNAGNKTATVALVGSNGKVVTEKTLGPLTKQLYDTLPQYSPSQQKVMLQYEDIHVELDLPADFREDKVSLYVATGAQKLLRDKPLKSDPRFIIRPDVCGHCYMLNELLLDNAEPIILDEKNNTYTGPDGYFKIVIDDFDGERINAWHIEDKTGRKTPNLAEYSRNNVDVMVGFNGTTENFLRKTLLKRLAYREVWRLK
jgi:hypothetical protein